MTNDGRAIFFGGGIHVPLKERVSLFADGQMMIDAETGELLAVDPDSRRRHVALLNLSREIGCALLSRKELST